LRNVDAKELEGAQPLEPDSQRKFPPVNYPPDPNPRKPRWKLPPGSWDTHFHAHGPPQLFPYAEGRNYTPPAAPIEHYFNLASVLGLERGVIVQTAVQGKDPASLIDAMQKSEGRLRGIIRANPDLDKTEIRKLHATGVRGIRLNLVGKLHGGYDEAFFNRAVASAVAASWVVTMHIDPENLVKLADVIRRIPAPTVIDNFGQVDARPEFAEPALGTLLDLAREPNVWIKTAAAYRMLKKGATPEQMTKVARAVHAASPDRTIWGSNWPHSDYFEPNMMPNDGDLVDMLLDFVPDEATRRKLMVDNPARLFDFT
jgi:predicted TIM-barrel fold metal-dependent hydrolase